MKERNFYVKKLIFDSALRMYENSQAGQRTIQSLFG